MSWKKNVFSCLMWLVYLVIVVTAMIFTGRVICDSFGVADYFKLVVPAVYLLFTGILVFALHRMADSPGGGSFSRAGGLAWAEGIVVTSLFAAGLFARVMALRSGAFGVPDESVYLELAYLSADGPEIPQFSHGAVYLYLWALRLCFMLLGNKAVAALWLQVGLQALGVLLLYLAVRKLAGRLSAVIMAAFFLLSPYMAQKSLVLSPEMLYLLVFAFVLFFISRGVKSALGWGFWMAAGAMAAVLSYLDVAGFLLLPLMLGVIIMCRQDARRKIAGGLWGCIAGFLLGAAGCIYGDVICSGKTVSGILSAWAELYQWKELRLSVTLAGFDMVWMIVLILGLMAWGIFSFWCDRERERFTVWIFCLCGAALMQCLGMFTEEMNGFIYLFFFSVVLAGLGIRESMAVCEEGHLEEEEETGPYDLEVVDLDQTDLDSEENTITEGYQSQLEGDIESAGEESDLEEPEGKDPGSQSLFAPDGAENVGDGSGQEEPEGNDPGSQSLFAPDGAENAGEESDLEEPEGNLPGVGNQLAPANHVQTLKGMRQKGKAGEETGIVGENKKRELSKTAETEETNPAAMPGKETVGPKGFVESGEKKQEKRKIEFLENPLPLPKKHVKRVMNYKLDEKEKEFGGYDIDVPEDDDFDY